VQRAEAPVRLVLGTMLALAAAELAHAGPGDLDPTFGAAGKVVTPIGGGSPSSLALQADGKIVVAGLSANGRYDWEADYDFAVVRYDPDGTLDPSFGGTGKVTTPIGTSDDRANSVAVQPDGKIVAAGESSGPGGGFAVVRYNPDGTLDDSFGDAGKVTTPIGSTGGANSVAVQPDGKIVAAGASWNGRNYDFAVVRYDAEGALDTTFGGTGKVTTPVGTRGDVAFSVALQTDGKIVAAGQAVTLGGWDFAVVRYHPDGTLDTSFRRTGKATNRIGTGTSDDGANSVAVQPDGKIVAAGSSWNGRNHDFALLRLNPDGWLDSSFGGTGTVTTPIGQWNSAKSVALQADGKIVAAGVWSDGRHQDVSVMRYNPDGTLDTSFGDTGKVITPIGTANAGATSVAVQRDGKIVAAASSSVDETGHFAVVRYAGGPTCGDGTLEVDEDCDDGNALDGDCCSSTCQHEPVAAPCPDGDVCNGDETCDGAGRCEPGTRLDCDDADACTQDSCDPVDGCENPAQPASTCVDTWGKSFLLVKEDRAGREMFLAHLLDGPKLELRDFGQPLQGGITAYTVCLYDDLDRLAGKLEVDRAGDRCGRYACWKGGRRRTYVYRDGSAEADGMRRVRLHAGAGGKSRIMLKAGNDSSKAQMSMPTGIAAKLAGSTSATVQIYGSDAPVCFSATFSTVRKDTGSLFKAR
jgi:uncharacterized delta-60 repeat protein